MMLRPHLVWLLVLFSTPAPALIPEPDSILFGSVTYNGAVVHASDGAIAVVAKVDGNSVARYRLGSSPDALDQYVLHVPMDALDPRTANTARVGDTVEIYVVNGSAETLAASLELDDRGTVLNVDLRAFNDSDGDGIPDEWERQFGLDPDDPSDANVDSNGDGLSNLDTFLASLESAGDDLGQQPVNAALPAIFLLILD